MFITYLIYYRNDSTIILISIVQALSMYNESRNEFQDLNVEHQHLKESLLSSIKETNIEIKYAEAVLESYIPRK